MSEQRGQTETSGGAVERLRMTKGLSKSELAGLSGVSSETIRRVLRGERVKPANRAAIAGVLGVTAKQIWPEGDGEDDRLHPDLDLRAYGFHCIRRWDDLHPLTTAGVRLTQVVPAPAPQTWFDADLLQNTVEEERRGGGSPCPALVDWQVDDGADASLSISVARSDYFRYAAVRRLMVEHPDRRAQVNAAAAVDLRRVVQQAPPSNTVINVTVTARDDDGRDRLLLMRRTHSVRTWQGYYGIGPHETMNWQREGHVPPGEERVESPFRLAARALEEECGLTTGDYGRIVMSWFGYYAFESSGYLFAHVRSQLSLDEIAERIDRAPSAFETGDVEWMPLDRDAIEAVLRTWGDDPREGRSGDDSATPYMPFALVSLTERWRVRAQLAQAAQAAQIGPPRPAALRRSR